VAHDGQAVDRARRHLLWAFHERTTIRA
jgi:hypothetical protein